jgi:hypothetical protein
MKSKPAKNAMKILTAVDVGKLCVLIQQIYTQQRPEEMGCDVSHVLCGEGSLCDKKQLFACIILAYVVRTVKNQSFERE